MRVKSLADHINDYSLSGPGVAVGDERFKAKGAEYVIPNDDEAKQLIDAKIVAKASAEK
jgi:hypothetical protein